MKMFPRWFPVILLFAIALATYAAEPEAASKLGPNSFGLTYTPIPKTFKFQSDATVNGWIKQNDTKSMIQHGWELWGGLTTMTSQVVDGKQVKIATFETWVDETTVFPPPPAPLASPSATAPRAKARTFSAPRQFQHDKEAPEKMMTVPGFSPIPRLVSVKYTKEIYDHVQTNKYFDTATMQALNAGFDKKGTPVADRVVRPFPKTSIMLKPTYAVVSGSAPTVLTYWTGPTDSSNPSVPDVATWNKKMQVVPPGVAAPTVGGTPNVGVDQFYAIKLNADEAAAITSLQQGTANPGDYALLVAMHVSSREIDNWTWQTFWWSFDKPAIPKSEPPVIAPFDHYNIAVGYSFTTGPDSAAGLNVVCYNPYLEAGFSNSTFTIKGQLGIESNCMSCHRTAVWPFNVNGPYFTGNGLIKPGDTYFKGTTKTDFVWGLPEDVPTPAPTAAPSP
jgi:hypothetical protein